MAEFNFSICIDISSKLKLCTLQRVRAKRTKVKKYFLGCNNFSVLKNLPVNTLFVHFKDFCLNLKYHFILLLLKMHIRQWKRL